MQPAYRDTNSGSYLHEQYFSNALFTHISEELKNLLNQATLVINLRNPEAIIISIDCKNLQVARDLRTYSQYLEAKILEIGQREVAGAICYCAKGSDYCDLECKGLDCCLFSFGIPISSEQQIRKSGSQGDLNL